MPEAPKPITQPFKLKKAIEDAQQRKREILQERKGRRKDMELLKSMTAKQKKKYQITKTMETVLEESDGDLKTVNEELRELEMERLAAVEPDPEIQEFKELAEKRIEDELQFMKKYYDPNAPMYDPEKVRVQKAKKNQHDISA